MWILNDDIFYSDMEKPDYDGLNCPTSLDQYGENMILDCLFQLSKGQSSYSFEYENLHYNDGANGYGDPDPTKNLYQRLYQELIAIRFGQ